MLRNPTTNSASTPTEHLTALNQTAHACPFPRNLRQHGIIWAACLNNCARKCTFLQKKRLVFDPLQPALQPTSVVGGLDIHMESRLAPVMSEHTSALTKNPHSNAPEARRPRDARRANATDFRLFHIVRVIRFKTERHVGGPTTEREPQKAQEG